MAGERGGGLRKVPCPSSFTSTYSPFLRLHFPGLHPTPPLRWHLNRSSMVSYLGMPRPPLHISLALLLQALDFLAPVVLDVWSGRVLMAFSFLTQCPISILYILFPPRVLPSLPPPFLSIGSLAGFSHFHDFNPLSSSPGPQCLGSAKHFSLGYPLAAGSPGVIVKPTSVLPTISLFFFFEMRLRKGGLSQRHRNLGHVSGYIFIPWRRLY